MDGCTSTETSTKNSPDFIWADGEPKTISDSGEVPVQHLPENDLQYIEQTNDLNPQGDNHYCDTTHSL